MYGWAMKLIVKNGYYKFYPSFVGEIKLWENKTGVRLYPCRDFWTFESLVDFPNYSFQGQPIKGFSGVVNYAGLPEIVMAKNKLTYNVKEGKITQRAKAETQNLDYSAGAYMTFPILPQVFALDSDGEVVTGLEAFVDVRLGTYKVERLFYEDI